MSLKNDLITTMSIVVALDVTLRSLGIEEGSPKYKQATELFAKEMGETMAKIELHRIAQELEDATKEVSKIKKDGII